MYINRCDLEIDSFANCGFELNGFLSFLICCEHHELTSPEMTKAPASLARCWGF